MRSTLIKASLRVVLCWVCLYWIFWALDFIWISLFIASYLIFSFSDRNLPNSERSHFPKFTRPFFYITIMPWWTSRFGSLSFRKIYLGRICNGCVWYYIIVIIAMYLVVFDLWQYNLTIKTGEKVRYYTCCIYLTLGSASFIIRFWLLGKDGSPFTIILLYLLVAFAENILYITYALAASKHEKFMRGKK